MVILVYQRVTIPWSMLTTLAGSISTTRRSQQRLQKSHLASVLSVAHSPQEHWTFHGRGGKASGFEMFHAWDGKGNDMNSCEPPNDGNWNPIPPNLGDKQIVNSLDWKRVSVARKHEQQIEGWKRLPQHCYRKQQRNEDHQERIQNKINLSSATQLLKVTTYRIWRLWSNWNNAWWVQCLMDSILTTSGLQCTMFSAALAKVYTFSTSIAAS